MLLCLILCGPKGNLLYMFQYCYIENDWVKRGVLHFTSQPHAAESLVAPDQRSLDG